MIVYEGTNGYHDIPRTKQKFPNDMEMKTCIKCFHEKPWFMFPRILRTKDFSKICIDCLDDRDEYDEQTIG